jgi:hypothetical protein
LTVNRVGGAKDGGIWSELLALRVIGEGVLSLDNAFGTQVSERGIVLNEEVKLTTTVFACNWRVISNTGSND